MRHAKLTLSPFLSPGLPSPVKRSAKPRAVLVVERGQKFGALTVMMQTRLSRGEAAAICRCSCGNAKTVRVQNLHTDARCICKSARIVKEAGRLAT